jgi:hypothetical protein
MNKLDNIYNTGKIFVNHISSNTWVEYIKYINSYIPRIKRQIGLFFLAIPGFEVRAPGLLGWHSTT